MIVLIISANVNSITKAIIIIGRTVSSKMPIKKIDARIMASTTLKSTEETLAVFAEESGQSEQALAQDADAGELVFFLETNFNMFLTSPLSLQIYYFLEAKKSMA